MSTRQSFHKNLICNTAAGPPLRFAASSPNFELARWPIFMNGNSNVLLQNDDFLGYDPDQCGLASGTGIVAEGFCFDISSFPGGISDGGGNEFVRNEVDPNGSCPE